MLTMCKLPMINWQFNGVRDIKILGAVKITCYNPIVKLQKKQAKLPVSGIILLAPELNHFSFCYYEPIVHALFPPPWIFKNII